MTFTQEEIELMDKWLVALRSGEYEQCTGWLRRDNCFCVAGLLCEVYDNTRWFPDGDMGSDGRKRYDYLAPDNHELWSGLYPNGMPLEDFVDNSGIMGMNDDGRTFSELADIIELRRDKFLNG